MSQLSQCRGPRARRAAGFTLVELLVVIGIIALLMSILMPSLARARASASLVSCESNFKQIFLALSMYGNDNKGMLPAASWLNSGGSYDGGATGTNERTFVLLSQILGTRIDDPNKDPLNPVFVCREAPQDGPAVWAPTVVRQIQFHPLAMPGYDQLSRTTLFPLRKLAQIRNSAEKIMFWEGAALPNWNVTSEPEAISLDGWRISTPWGHRGYDPLPADAQWEDMNRQVDVGQNRDEDWWVCGMRFRHMNNTTGPIGYFDGHVEAKKPAEIIARDICITPP